MQAVKGYFDDGHVKLDKRAPFRKGRIIVLFEEPAYDEYEDEDDERLDDDDYDIELMSDEESERLFKKFTGCIDRIIDTEKERDEYLNEKYGSPS